MKFLYSAIAAFLFLATGLAQADIVDQWDFSYADGTQLSAALSNNGISLGNDSAFAAVRNNALEFSSNQTAGTPTTLSTFRAIDLSVDPITSGVVEVAWDVVSANFALSDAVNGAGRVGFVLRLPGSPNVDLGARLVFNGNDFVIDYTDATGSNVSIVTWAGVNSLADLNIRYTVDLDNAGAAGSFNLFYTEGANAEVQAYSGTVPTGFIIEQFRTAQQVTNGGTNWQAGDTMLVDNLTVSTVVPEPATFALLAGIAGLGIVLYRRRRDNK